MRRPIDINNTPATLAYLQAVKKYHGSIRLADIVTDSEASYVSLESLYVEPEISRTQTPREERTSPFDLTSTIARALATKQHCVILGDPGSGKSTLVSWIATRLAATSENPYNSALKGVVPFPIVLREMPLGQCDSLLSLIRLFAIRIMGESLDIARLMAEVKRLLTNGQVLVILDGIDEIASASDRLALRDLVFKAQRQFDLCRWLFTSRPVGYDEVPFVTERMFDHWLAMETPLNPALPGLEMDSATVSEPVRRRIFEQLDDRYGQFYIKPFDDRRVSRYAGLWFSLREPVRSLAERETSEFVAAIQREDSLKDLARNPLLLAFLAFIHKRDVRLPSGRAEVYRRISEIFLDRIPLRKQLNDIPYRLDIKMRWLGKLALEMQKDGAVIWPNEVIQLRLLAIMRFDDPLSDRIKVEEFLRFISRRAGLLLPRSENTFGFVHRSFQEFFAAWSLSELVNSRKFTVPPFGEESDPKHWRELTANSISPEALAAALPALARESSWSDVLILTCSLVSEESGDIFTECLGAELFNAPVPTYSVFVMRLVLNEDCRVSESVRGRMIERFNHVLCRNEAVPVGYSSLFSRKDVGDAYLPRLARYNPKELMLFSIRASANSFEKILSLPNLEVVWLTGAKIGSRAFEQFRDCTTLQKLYLIGVPRGALKLAALKSATELRVLYFGPVKDYEPWIEWLSTLSRLEVLAIRGRGRSVDVMQGKCLEFARALSEVRTLELYSMFVSHALIDALASLPLLADVEFHECDIEKGGRKRLFEARPDINRMRQEFPAD